MFSMKTLQTLTLAAAAALLVSPAPATRAGDATATIKAETAPARNWVKEAMLSLKVRNKLLTRMKSTDALRIHIDTEGRTVTLTGAVEKESSLARAGSLARSVEGVRHVTNNLTHAPDKDRGAAVESAAVKGGHEIKDALLETKVKSKLLAQTGAPALKIEVEAENGVITLTGSAPDSAHRDRALRLTRDTGGVTKVNDQLAIAPAEKAAP